MARRRTTKLLWKTTTQQSWLCRSFSSSSNGLQPHVGLLRVVTNHAQQNEQQQQQQQQKHQRTWSSHHPSFPLSLPRLPSSHQTCRGYQPKTWITTTTTTTIRNGSTLAALPQQSSIIASNTTTNTTMTATTRGQQIRNLADIPMGSNGDEEEETRREVAADLFFQYSVVRSSSTSSPPNAHGGGGGGVVTTTTMEEPTLSMDNFRSLLQGIGADEGKYKDESQLKRLFQVADTNGDGYIQLSEFLEQSNFFLDGNPARIILVVGGPGSGKGVLCHRLQHECHAVHLSSGELLRHEVARGSALGRQVQDIMTQGQLVSSAIMVALMKQHMRNHPGKRVLLDGFPRSLENAHDLTTLCGKPELALHLVCDDTVLLERILGRGADLPAQHRRQDDNFQTALERLRTFHKYHHQTMEWLREQHVPIVNLDCSGTPESVWQQLQAIGRLMRPAVKVPSNAPPSTLSSSLSSIQSSLSSTGTTALTNDIHSSNVDIDDDDDEDEEPYVSGKSG